jgi:sporulation protein YlmC with PRC-barrel domain
MTSSQGVLRPLSESGRTVADPEADVRGRTVVDRSGEEVGRVDDLVVDDREERVRFLRVAEGGFLGLGAAHYLVPVDAVVSVDPEGVRIDRDRGGMGNVPAYDPELADRQDYYEGVYGWWGAAPFWGGGYVYPPFPR